MNPSGEDGFDRVADLIAAGDVAGAREILRRLAVDSGRALRLLATLERVAGDPDAAVDAAGRAAELAGTDDDLAVAAYAELGESLVAAGRPAEAADAYGSAAARATTARARAGLLRMRAFALAAAGRNAESTAILRDLAAGAGDPELRAALLVQAAGNLIGGTAAAQLWQEAHDAVGAAEAAGALRADLAFVAAASALDAGNLRLALAEIREARRQALSGVAVLQYLAAAVAESAVAELLGDDLAAYASLATGYATLGDVVGKALSGSTFEGPLRTLRDRWGADRFARAKRAYEEARRRIGSAR